MNHTETLKGTGTVSPVKIKLLESSLTTVQMGRDMVIANDSGFVILYTT